VPEANYVAALSAEHDFIEIVSIATIDDAIEFLDELQQT
jgi:hypothetical protein